MHVPAAFREDDLDTLCAIMREARLCKFITATAEGPIATPLPLCSLIRTLGPMASFTDTSRVTIRNGRFRLCPRAAACPLSGIHKFMAASVFGRCDTGLALKCTAKRIDVGKAAGGRDLLRTLTGLEHFTRNANANRFNPR